LNKKVLVHIELLVEPQFLAEFLRNWRKSPKFGTAYCISINLKWHSSESKGRGIVNLFPI